MNNQKENKHTYIAFLLVAVLSLVGLIGCGVVEVGAADPGVGGINSGGSGFEPVNGIEIGIEPTPKPQNLIYTNSFYGFQFTYPETWTLEEKDYSVLLKQGTLTLRINHRWTTEENPDPRTGAPAGDFIYGGKITFLGQIIPVEILEFERKAKAVFYNGGPEIEVDDLIFTIVLEDLYADYQSLDISPEAQNDALMVLESFVRITPQGSPDMSPPPAPSPKPITEAPHEGWLQYLNSEYRFSFWHPSSFSLVEEPNAVKLAQDDWELVIAFGWMGQDLQIVSGETLEGQFQMVGFPSKFLGQEIQVFLNTFDGKVKTVFYGQPLLEIDTGASQIFAITLNAVGDGFEPGDYLSELHPQMDEILATFRLVEIQ
jgi:hypothetical protein